MWNLENSESDVRSLSPDHAYRELPMWAATEVLLLNRGIRPATLYVHSECWMRSKRARYPVGQSAGSRATALRVCLSFRFLSFLSNYTWLRCGDGQIGSATAFGESSAVRLRLLIVRRRSWDPIRRSDPVQS